MAKYIEREAAIKMAKPYWQTDEDGFGVEWLFNKEPIIFKKDVEAIPAADVAPVRHGRWEWYDSFSYRCSACKKYWISPGDQYDYHYCPNCGARMDLVTDCNRVKDGDGE